MILRALRGGNLILIYIAIVVSASLILELATR